jgi:hypothetical protein
MYCLCVNVYCHRLTTQLQLINISYRIITLKLVQKHRAYESVRVDPSAPRYDSVVCTCERGNWPSIYIKRRGTLRLWDCQLLNNGLGRWTYLSHVTASVFRIKYYCQSWQCTHRVARCFVHYSRQSLGVYQGLKQPSATNTRIPLCLEKSIPIIHTYLNYVYY